LLSVDAIAANRDPAILWSAGCIDGNGATLRRFRTCGDRAWRANPPRMFAIASMPVATTPARHDAL
jgi:hypothetical protein